MNYLRARLESPSQIKGSLSIAIETTSSCQGFELRALPFIPHHLKSPDLTPVIGKE